LLMADGEALSGDGIGSVMAVFGWHVSYKEVMAGPSVAALY